VSLDDGAPATASGRSGAPQPQQKEHWMARSRSKHRRKRMTIRQHWKKRRERKKAAAASTK